jgi:hypothetical protein
MPLVTALPDRLSTALNPFRGLFGAPAYRHFQTYVCGLVVSENLTVEGINRNFVDRKHPSSLNRYLTWAIWDAQAVNDKRIEILKSEGDLSGKGWLVIDDTLTHKTGKAIDAVGIFRDHAEKRFVLGHNIVTAIFVRKDGTCHPLGFRLYLKEEYCKEHNKAFKSKIELAK